MVTPSNTRGSPGQDPPGLRSKQVTLTSLTNKQEGSFPATTMEKDAQRKFKDVADKDLEQAVFDLVNKDTPEWVACPGCKSGRKLLKNHGPALASGVKIASVKCAKCNKAERLHKALQKAAEERKNKRAHALWRLIMQRVCNGVPGNGEEEEAARTEATTAQAQEDVSPPEERSDQGEDGGVQDPTSTEGGQLATATAEEGAAIRKAQEDLAEAKADASLARAETEELRAQLAQMEEEFRDRLQELQASKAELQAANAKLQADTDRLTQELARRPGTTQVDKAEAGTEYEPQTATPETERDDLLCPEASPQSMEGRLTRIEQMIETLTGMQVSTETRQPQTPHNPDSYAGRARASDSQTRSNETASKRTTATQERATPRGYRDDMFKAANWQPQTFHRRYLWLNKAPRGLARHQRHLNVWAFLEKRGIRDKVRKISLIGQEMVELYVADAALSRVDGELEHILIKNYQPQIIPPVTNDNVDIKKSMVMRLGRLLAREGLKQMQECILRGYPEEIQQAARTVADELRRGSRRMPVTRPPTPTGQEPVAQQGDQTNNEIESAETSGDDDAQAQEGLGAPAPPERTQETVQQLNGC